jgi:putative hydrolase of the HAD superfamily
VVRLRRFRVSHVVLDVDGTLIDFDSALTVALAAAADRASEFGATVTPDVLTQTRDWIAADAAMRGRTLRELRDESFRRVLAARGAVSEAAVAAVSTAYYRARDAAIRPFPDVEAALDEIVGRGFTIVAATNGNAALGRHPFFARFAHVHVAELAGVSKPDPRFFAGALAASGGRAETALSVGDRVENDYAPARAIGMSAVLLDRLGRVSDESINRIASLAELPALIDLA